MGFETPKPFTAKEKDFTKSRIESDANLVKGGADIGNDGSIVPTKKQIEQIENEENKSEEKSDYAFAGELNKENSYQIAKILAHKVCECIEKSKGFNTGDGVVDEIQEICNVITKKLSMKDVDLEDIGLDDNEGEDLYNGMITYKGQEIIHYSGGDDGYNFKIEEDEKDLEKFFEIFLKDLLNMQE
ncbi:MAG: hypothetical protein WCK16_02160 [Candidatus Moraniibacteriota bacterium]